MSHRALIVPLLLIATLVAPAAAQACSCARMDREAARETLRRADAAIIGKLLERKVSGSEAILTYRIRRSFKRAERFREGERLKVRTSRYGSTCGIEQRVGSVRGLFAFRSRKRMRSSLCMVVARRKMRRAARSRDASTSGAGLDCSAR